MQAPERPMQAPDRPMQVPDRPMQAPDRPMQGSVLNLCCTNEKLREKIFRKKITQNSTRKISTQ